MWHSNRRGFTLIEVLIALAIIGILASIVFSTFSRSTAVSRDAQRQSDLRMLQAAIEQYKQKYGEYPARGCGASGSSFSGENTCQDYIAGLAPEFLPRLPRDPRREGNIGYAYITNNNRSVYKIMAVNTVESEIVSHNHNFKPCDVLLNSNGTGVLSRDIKIGGVCAPAANSETFASNWCITSRSNGAYFRSSYGLWGGFELGTQADQYSSDPLSAFGVTSSQYRNAIAPTAQVICRHPLVN